MQTKTFKWVFRVASGPKSGGGHLMRSLALAQVLSKTGRVLFFLDKEGKSWREYLETFGFDIVIGARPEQFECFAAIIDGYVFGPTEYDWLRNFAKYIIIIDDRIEVIPFADLAILPSINSTTFDAHPRVLSGCRYALLGPEYQEPCVWKPNGAVNKLLISFGIVDSLHCTTATLHALRDVGFNGEVRVMLSSDSKQINQLNQIAKQAKYRLHLAIGEYGAHQHISWSDFVIGAGGQNLVERIALGRPSITVVTADNQKGQVVYFERIGATKVTIRRQNTFVSDLSKSLYEILRSPMQLARMSTVARSCVDGKGTERVANALYGLVA